MAWQKSSPELIARFKGALPDHPDAEPSQMFGYPCCFVKGNFFTGLFEERVVLRLPGDIRGKLPEMAGAEPFGPMGRVMKDWYLVPVASSADERRLAQLLAAAFREVEKLPPKEKKERRTKAKEPSARKPPGKRAAPVRERQR